MRTLSGRPFVRPKQT